MPGLNNENPKLEIKKEVVMIKYLISVFIVLLLSLNNCFAQITSASSGNWSSTSTWVGSAVPKTTDNVIIANGHTVKIDQNVIISNLTVGGGTSGVLTFDETSGRSMTISGNVVIKAGASFIVNNKTVASTGDLTTGTMIINNVNPITGIVIGMGVTGTGVGGGAIVTSVGTPSANDVGVSVASTVTATGVSLSFRPVLSDSLTIGGNLTNDGTFDMSMGSSLTVCNVNFTGTGTQTITGATPVLTQFRTVSLNKGSLVNKVTCNINVSGAGGFFSTVLTGTWEQTAGRLTVAGTSNMGSATNSACGLNFIGSGSGKFTSALNIFGSFLVNTTDSLLIGSGWEKLDFTKGTPIATLTKGTVFILGKFVTSALCNLTINGANIIIDPKGFANQVPPGTDYAFRSTTGTGGSFPLTFTSGSVTILNSNAVLGSSPEIAMSSSIAANISGSAVFILGQGANTVPSDSGFRIQLNSSAVLNHLIVNTGNLRVNLLSNVTLNGDLVITSSGPLTGGFFWNARKYIFDGKTPQVTGMIMPATVKSVVINNSSGVTSSQSLTITDTLFLVSGTLSGPYTAGTTVTGTAVKDELPQLPGGFLLSQNYPNPFNPTTSIFYSIPKSSFVELKVYDIIGKEVVTLVNEQKAAGIYNVKFDGANLSTGVYMYRLTSGNNVVCKKMMLIK
jgi:hypothetical protein